MQTILQQKALRTRLEDSVRTRFGNLSPSSVKALSKEARLHYTTLARYLLYPKGKRTLTLRGRTLDAVALALDVDLVWLRDGQGLRQLKFWPILIPTTAEVTIGEPLEEVRAVIDQVRMLPRSVQIRAFRAAVAAMLELVIEQGQVLDGRAYRSLMRLDALQRTGAQSAVG